MRKIVEKWWLIVLLAILLSIASVWIFASKYSFYIIDLSTSEAANVADTINGLTSPVLTIITILLVFLTFNDQRKYIREQQKELNKKDVNDKANTINNEMKELLNIMETFSTTAYAAFGAGNSVVMTGFQAITTFIKSFDIGLPSNYRSDYSQLHHFLLQYLFVVKSIEALSETDEKRLLEIKLKNLTSSKFVFLSELQERISFGFRSYPTEKIPMKDLCFEILNYKIVRDGLKITEPN
ncbi:MAG: hypothetical protein EOO47_00075 [Flavobacterium sp.]|nr:MAG: hypothetical protein EOO47_00075 [Flavobacterium sp.]